jgi:hypothetical protein
MMLLDEGEEGVASHISRAFVAAVLKSKMMM